MNVIRSTHSSRLSRLPRRSIRSSYGTSTFVTVGADIAPPFIQYRGLVWDSGVRSLGLGPRISATKVQVTPRSPVANQRRAGHTCKTDGRGGGRSMDGHQTIGIAGVGKMGEALVRGLLVGRVVPIMHNLPCAVREGATAFALGKTAMEHDALSMEEIFGAVGRVTLVE